MLRELTCCGVPSSPLTPCALVLNGTVGAGKTATADAISELLRGRGVAHAVLDLDSLRRAWPAPARDPFNAALGVKNLAAMSRNFLEAGASHLVLAGVIESKSDRAQVEAAVGVPVTVCRLQVDPALLQQRLMRRHPPGSDLDWHLGRAPQLAQTLVHNAIDDHVVAVEQDAPRQVAERVLRLIAWR